VSKNQGCRVAGVLRVIVIVVAANNFWIVVVVTLEGLIPPIATNMAMRTLFLAIATVAPSIVPLRLAVTTSIPAVDLAVIALEVRAALACW
jgi:hypothetical protein